MRIERVLCSLLGLSVLLCLWTSHSQGQIPEMVSGASGISVTIEEQVVFKQGRSRLTDWEPYTSAFGDGVLILAANTWLSGYAEETERGAVATFGTDGMVVEHQGFFDDDQNPWTANNDIVRVNGNPPRVAGDKRTRLATYQYLFANECTPWADPGHFREFTESGLNYDAEVACVQLLLNDGDWNPPVAHLTDPLYGKATSGAQNGKPTLFGGEIRCLSNGNFAVVIEDQTGNTIPVDRASLATVVDAQDGSSTIGEVIIGPFNANQGANPNAVTGIWSNMSAL